MESVEAPLKCVRCGSDISMVPGGLTICNDQKNCPLNGSPKTRYIIETAVQGVVEHNTRKYVNGVGGTAQFEYPSLGWFAHFHGSHEAICLVKSLDGKSPEKPDLSMGDKVRITIERIG